jgi:hypothetical protein
LIQEDRGCFEAGAEESAQESHNPTTKARKVESTKQETR